MDPPIPHFDSSSFLETSKRNQSGTNKLKFGMRTSSSPILENPEETMGSAGGDFLWGTEIPNPESILG